MYSQALDMMNQGLWPGPSGDGLKQGAEFGLCKGSVWGLKAL